MGSPLILLDRDGVLNRMVIDEDHGTIDSPLHPEQVQLLPGVAEALARLTDAGYDLAIVSNQPAWAKRKTTRQNLEAVHEAVVRTASSAGARILSSHLCLHRSEDGCDCRKPRTGLLREAIALRADCDLHATWMVGDGVTDVQAGATLELNTAFLGPRKCDACKIFADRGLQPSYWGPDLPSFTEYLLNQRGPSR